jgi:hypothetical protein
MKKQFYFFIVGLTLIFIMPSCKRFEDGNNFSIRTVKGRLVKGSPWVFEKLEVDGIDKSDEFRADSAYFDEINFINTEDLMGSEDYSFETVSEFCYSAGQFILENGNHIQLCAVENGGCNPYYRPTYYDYGPIFLHTYIDWEITRITMKELQIKTTYFYKEYKLYLKSQEE